MSCRGDRTLGFISWDAGWASDLSLAFLFIGMTGAPDFLWLDVSYAPTPGWPAPNICDGSFLQRSSAGIQHIVPPVLAGTLAFSCRFCRASHKAPLTIRGALSNPGLTVLSGPARMPVDLMSQSFRKRRCTPTIGFICASWVKTRSTLSRCSWWLPFSLGVAVTRCAKLDMAAHVACHSYRISRISSVSSPLGNLKRMRSPRCIQQAFASATPTNQPRSIAIRPHPRFDKSPRSSLSAGTVAQIARNPPAIGGGVISMTAGSLPVA